MCYEKAFCLSAYRPRSWVLYEKSFNPIMSQFHFKTKYANASSGYDRIVDETLTWQSK